MRKTLIWITVVTLIVSIVGTGVIVYIDVTTPVSNQTDSVTGENAK